MRHPTFALALAASLAVPFAATADPTISLFADVSGGVTDTPGSPAAFGLGDFTLFATSQIGEHFDTLGEVLFEVGPTGFNFDVERVQLRYSLNDRLRIGAGRFYSHVGYYNVAFQHAAYLETTVRTPLAIEDEDNGGTIPVHSLGVFAEGFLPLSHSARLAYALDVTNGRPAEPGGLTDVVGALSAGKAANLQLSIQLPNLGLRFGGNALYGRIPPSTVPATAHGWMGELIAGLFVAYTHAPVELFAEQYVLWHDTHGTGGQTSVILSGFAHLALRFGVVRPYIRGDYRRFDPTYIDPYYRRGGAGGDNLDLMGTTGVALDLAEGVVLKLEYEHRFQGLLSGANTVTVQVAWRF